MSKAILRCLTFLVLTVALSPAHAHGSHAFTSFDLEDLASVKERIAANDPRIDSAFKELIRRANSAVARAPRSVHDKSGVAPSGDKRDFYSMGKYSWPDDKHEGATAYVHRDGLRNPEATGQEYDKKNFNETVRSINILSLAYYFTGDRRYAEKAVELIRTWFTDPITGMKPNFRHAAIQPGVHDGSSLGIIEGVVLVEMLDYVALLNESGTFPAPEEAALKAWFGSLAKWLRESDFGRMEATATNNRGSWYYAQLLAFSLYSGNDADAASMLPHIILLLRNQFAPDGSMPREMKRADSKTYSIYGLRSFITLGNLSDRLGHSLWNEASGGCPILLHALRYQAPYYAGRQPWPFRPVNNRTDQYAVQVFRLGGQAYQTEEFNVAIEKIIDERPDTDRHTKLLGPPPTIPH